MFNMLKKLFSSENDRTVDAINKESAHMLRSAAKQAKRNNDLLKKNGITLQIFIASGGDERGH